MACSSRRRTTLCCLPQALHTRRSACAVTRCIGSRMSSSAPEQAVMRYLTERRYPHRSAPRSRRLVARPHAALGERYGAPGKGDRNEAVAAARRTRYCSRHYRLPVASSTGASKTAPSALDGVVADARIGHRDANGGVSRTGASKTAQGWLGRVVPGVIFGHSRGDDEGARIGAWRMGPAGSRLSSIPASYRPPSTRLRRK